MTKTLRIKRVIAAVAVATTIIVAPITYVTTVYVVPAVTAHAVEADVHAVEAAVDNVIAQVTDYCTANQGTCGFYKSQEIVKWMDKEHRLYGYTVSEAQALLDIRDSNK